MAFFNPASSPSPPPTPPQKIQISQPTNDIDDFLSSDLELSFASTMSLNSPSPSRAPSPISMDISPAVPPKSHTHLAPPVPRLFGRDLLNEDGGVSSASTKSNGTTSSNRGRQRATLPAKRIASGDSSIMDEPSRGIFYVPETFSVPSPDDAMDIDMISSSPSAPAALADHTSAIPAPTAQEPSYSNLFIGVATPPGPHAAPAKKRRSLSPEGNQSTGSSDPPSSSPPHAKFTRAATVGAAGQLFKKKPALDYNAPSSKRIPQRRPALSALVGAVSPVNVSGDVESAYSVSSSPGLDNGPLTAPLPPARRAFSAMIPPATQMEPSSDDSSDIQTSSPAAAYAKRHHARILRRCDGSEDLRPLHGAGSLGKRDREDFQGGENARVCSPKSLAGFGVKEVEKKLLPCHRVSEDGLVRITCSTLKDLIHGVYSTQVSSFTIVDCRFEYEYDGGHIPGAINLNTADSIEGYFLGPNKPAPCESGDPTAKTVLIFHCEFSVKRAPTFAKHVRSKDRSMNGRVYPKVCYPEMYILEGGYSQFYEQFPDDCEPNGYVQMDDPAHTHARDIDLDKFRRGKWGRTQSFTYGQPSSGTSALSTLPSAASSSTATSREHRKTAPSGGPCGGTMFAAANAARGRRAGVALKGLSTLDEDASSSGHEDSESNGLQDSPCPPPSKGPSRLSSGRSNLERAGSSFGPARR
ncbi:hypothetical protein JB92DRAFT_1769698 [Gautieria morchelliformis]|nr:hypothetical protein JB92DRAFT_1769698 [Gautieria morchelliformis]